MLNKEINKIDKVLTEEYKVKKNKKKTKARKNLENKTKIKIRNEKGVEFADCY